MEQILIDLIGRIDSNNASDVEKEIQARVAGTGAVPVVLDASALDYISSAGLRVLLRLKKTHPDLTITGVNSEVYEILEMTGFTELMTVEKAYKVVSVAGCEVIGEGANGKVYRIDADTVVKTYKNADALSEIQHEREVARLALILGVPTAISYDVVRVGDSYGSVFELLNARSFSKILATEPEKLDWCVQEFVGMLRKIHGTLVPPGKLPDMKARVLAWTDFLQDYLPDWAGEKLRALVQAVPQDDHMIHGDYHTKNLELQNDEVLLIDMDTLSVGHPVFELAFTYNALVGMGEVDHTVTKRFQGFDYALSQTFWHKALAAYLGTENEETLRAVEDKARILGYARMIRRSIRRGGLETEAGRAEIDHWKTQLLDLLKRTDTLLFIPNELEVEAAAENLPEVLSFLDAHLELADCPAKVTMQLDLAAEEIFVNVARYAYAPGTGAVTVRVECTENPAMATVTFLDHGAPFDPLKKEDPDVHLSAEDREIGGLGIYLTKKTMDDVRYRYVDGHNILTMVKRF